MDLRRNELLRQDAAIRRNNISTQRIVEQKPLTETEIRKFDFQSVEVPQPTLPSQRLVFQNAPSIAARRAVIEAP